ncbi:hypothetical protein HK097_003097 [Rhizophlyctis rosea]|uniref:Uncharacterized protein n=1 Tax=Rhizophlyctis rosea TaxID=64517 RepID=A0AAD5SG29_9FUNG|nr:hypothetical protein HK097_003097 [Rhizophlyctis rosea]
MRWVSMSNGKCEMSILFLAAKNYKTTNTLQLSTLNSKNFFTMLDMFFSVGAVYTYLSGAFAYNVPLEHKIGNNFTTDKTTVKRSPIHSHGLFATADMPKGTKIIEGSPMCYNPNRNIHQHLCHTSPLEMQNANAVPTFMEPSAIRRIINATEQK